MRQDHSVCTVMDLLRRRSVYKLITSLEFTESARELTAGSLTCCAVPSPCFSIVLLIVPRYLRSEAHHRRNRRRRRRRRARRRSRRARRTRRRRARRRRRSEEKEEGKEKTEDEEYRWENSACAQCRVLPAVRPLSTSWFASQVRISNARRSMAEETGERRVKMQISLGRRRTRNFSPDGTILASGGQDHIARIWDRVERGTLPRAIEPRGQYDAPTILAQWREAVHRCRL